MIKIWERYILREFFKLFVLFLFGFYFLYVVVDYSAHMQDLALGKGLSLFKVIQYYLLQFIKRMDILLPLAVLISSIKVLCQLNLNKELLAFQSAGLKLKRLIRPLILVGSLACCVNLAVNQFAVPYSLNFIDKFHDAHLRHSFRGKRIEPLQVMHLEDHSKLVYQYYDAAKEAFFDVIWIKTPDDLWHMRYLKADPKNQQGEWVDHLQKKEDGSFEKTESYPSWVFDELQWSADAPRRGFIPFENRSIEDLWKIYKTDPLLTSNERQQVVTQILFKVIMPFLALIVLIAIIPFCTSHANRLPQFLLYSVSLFSFVAFIALMDAAVIIGESGTLSPIIAILSPFILLLSMFGWKYIKVQ
ncbi:MAG: LptF/LptG family permease [Simkaniaceae bacterium]|nr:LptF/LptG family permease [Candidatus Sacchlamyda saccharinae]